MTNSDHRSLLVTIQLLYMYFVFLINILFNIIIYLQFLYIIILLFILKLFLIVYYIFLIKI